MGYMIPLYVLGFGYNIDFLFMTFYFKVEII